jgi:hypothetical protein
MYNIRLILDRSFGIADKIGMLTGAKKKDLIDPNVQYRLVQKGLCRQRSTDEEEKP